MFTVLGQKQQSAIPEKGKFLDFDEILDSFPPDRPECMNIDQDLVAWKLSRAALECLCHSRKYMCHGPIPVSAADLVQGKKINGWLASKDAVTSMGGEFNANWAAALDGNHVPDRTTPELPEFIDAVTVELLK